MVNLRRSADGSSTSHGFVLLCVLHFASPASASLSQTRSFPVVDSKSHWSFFMCSAKTPKKYLDLVVHPLLLTSGGSFSLGYLPTCQGFQSVKSPCSGKGAILFLFLLKIINTTFKNDSPEWLFIQVKRKLLQQKRTVYSTSMFWYIQKPWRHLCPNQNIPTSVTNSFIIG